MRNEDQLQVARVALAACGSRGYALGGSLAMQVHGVVGTRDSGDVDLLVNELLDDADAVRDQVAQALRRAGYHVEHQVSWGVTSDAAGTQNSEMRVSHPEHGTIHLQMVCLARYMKPVDRDGMPVIEIGDCLYRKIKALENRLGAKDFIDLALLQQHMSQTNADRYIRTYVTGMAQLEDRPEAEVARDLYQAYVQVAQIPDEAFAAYGYTPAQAVEIRTAVLTWADRLAPAANPMRRDTGIASGHLPITRQDAEAALNRMAHDPSMTRLSDQQLSSWRAEVTASMLKALSARQNLGHLRQQLQPIAGELERRAELTPYERAAEDAVRRAEEAEEMPGGDPGRLGPLGVLVRLKSPSTAPPLASPTRTPPSEVLLHQQHLQAHQYIQPGTGRQA
ncbi:hypothetical protein AB0942_09620 [Streptomyces nodosus]|uniref:hypothetical protein n=1 Tax=Streptomyces nodosus TaxID=40318 RepID=UPI003456579C